MAFPGGLAEQVRQSRVEATFGKSQESESASESASKTGAQGRRSVKLRPKKQSQEKRQPWNSRPHPHLLHHELQKVRDVCMVQSVRHIQVVRVEVVRAPF